MKRLFAFLIFVAVAAALGYWVQTRHGGNLHRAWLQVVATVTVPFRSVPAETTAGTRPGGGEAQRARGGQGQSPAIAVVTAIAERADLPITRTSVGWVEPIATVTVRPRIDGQILEQHVKDGQMVKEGDILFRLDDREIQAQIARDQATLTRDQAMLAKTQADLRRAQELLSKNVGSPVQAEQIAADVKIASANVAASEAALAADRIRLGYTTIKAPIAGRVGVVRVTEGNLVRGSDAGGDGLATITQMQPLRVTFSLPERDLDLLREVAGAVCQGRGGARHAPQCDDGSPRRDPARPGRRLCLYREARQDRRAPGRGGRRNLRRNRGHRIRRRPRRACRH
jgi:membrane fusion protein, multidrug efflux system